MRLQFSTGFRWLEDSAPITEGLGNADALCMATMPAAFRDILAGSKCCYSGKRLTSLLTFNTFQVHIFPSMPLFTNLLNSVILASLCKVLIMNFKKELWATKAENRSLFCSLVSTHKESTAALPSKQCQERALWYRAKLDMDFSCSFTLYHIKMRNLHWKTQTKKCNRLYCP